MYRKALLLIILLVFASGWGCVDKGPADGNGSLSGVVLVDGSSTVFPLTEAVAEEFQIANPGVMITV
ncbi:MAG: hypothetical protein ACXQTL_05010, partial [Methanosarcinales archaeon]